MARKKSNVCATREAARERLRQMADEVASGVKPQDVADKYGVSHELVRMAMRRLGVSSQWRTKTLGERDRVMVEMAESGHGVAYIAEEMAIPVATVKGVLQRRKATPCQIRIRAIVAELKAGKSVGDMASLFGYSEAAVRKMAKDNSVPVPRKPNTKRGATADVIAALLASDKPAGDIAEDLGISRQRVFQVIEEAVAAGVPIPQRRKLSRYKQSARDRKDS